MLFIALGLLIGILAFVPLLLSLKASKKLTSTSNFGYGSLLMLGVFSSLVILFVSVLLCYLFAKDNIVLFVIPAAIMLICFAVFYGIYTVIKRNKPAKERRQGNKGKNK